MLDVLTIGRSSVDLYGQQIGGRLEDMATFAKAVGGCPTNIAVGCARLGLRAGLITRVGDEHMGRFIREQLIAERVDVSGVITDKARLTALVLLGVRNEHDFPLIFYRENCADMALCEADIDPDLIGRTKAVVLTGTHLSAETTRGASMKAARLAKAAGARLILDIDYRPNLWGLAGHGAGASRFVNSQTVTAMMAQLLPACDLIVGTEEEFHIAGGSADTLTAIRNVRDVSAASLVCKRGPMGCAVFAAAIPADLNDGIQGPGFPVEVYNVLGAGDAFMAGLLRGWLRDESWAVSARWANACGAIAVSRLLCSPEYPTWPEMQHFLASENHNPRLREDGALNHLHRTSTRLTEQPELMALAIDHRKQLADLCRSIGVDTAKLERFKLLAIEAAARTADGGAGFGVLCDDRYGRAALFKAEEYGLWVARPVEEPGSIPLSLECGHDLGAHLIEWPASHVVKALSFYHPDDEPVLRAVQDRALLHLQEAALKLNREFLIEIIAGKSAALEEATVARVLDHLYSLGIKPDWWKLEPQISPAAWARIDAVIARHDPACRGVVILGLEAEETELRAAFQDSAGSRSVKGFAVGRTIFSHAAELWLRGEIDDEAAIEDMASRFRSLVALWRGRTRNQIEA